MSKKVYICDSCGNEFPKWQGQCPGCGDWNRIKEFKVSKLSSKKGKEKIRRPLKIDKVSVKDKERIRTKLKEFDLVLGGGLVAGSLVLLSGQPGIGKSTILLQVAGGVDGRVIYFSGEESEQQIKARYDRLGLKQKNIELLSSQNINNLEKVASEDLKLIIIDSIQTVFDPNTDQSAGGVAQIKTAGYRLQKIAKEKNIPVIITGHITKQGRIAGPMALEHLVDCVLYLEGDDRYDQRILKSIKNRFGSTGEVGIFRMTKSGMREIDNPSSLFLSDSKSPGTMKGSIMEGQRPLLIEVQALAERSVFGYPKRRSQGIPASRLEVLAAVISNKTKVNLSDKDIYVSIVGGLSVDEPSIDLAVCLSIISSVGQKACRPDLACFGEVDLSGEIRPVAFSQTRLKEVKKQGFKKVLIAKDKGRTFKSNTLDIITVSTLKEAIEESF